MPFIFHILRFIYLFGSQNYRKKERFLSNDAFPRDQDSARPKPGSKNCTQVFHMGGRGPKTWLFFPGEEVEELRQELVSIRQDALQVEVSPSETCTLC